KQQILTDDDFMKKHGDLGNVYGKQWRNWVSADGQQYDQLKALIEQIKTNPNSRRHIISAWNPTEIETMALPPCHTLFQFYVQDNKLSCQLYQRSADIFLGVPFNIASYSLLTHLIAKECGLEVGEFVHTFGDAHIYSNHLDAVKTQLARSSFAPPELKINTDRSIFDIEYEDLEIVNYESHPAIKAPIAV
ncbi:thymidylate synthase, partial [Staphylococcus pseudintermedius]